jgi:hypothetical protein
MEIVLNSLLYSFLGLGIGFFTHLFFGLIQSSIVFDKRYLKSLLSSFLKLCVVFLLVNVMLIPFAIFMPVSEFTTDLIYYLMAFAGFDFTYHVVKFDSKK